MYSYSESRKIREIFEHAFREGLIAEYGDRDHPMALLFGEAAEQIQPVRLIWAQRDVALQALGEEAKRFSNPDGDWWLAPVRAFSPGRLADLGYNRDVFDGYAFPYLRSVAINRNLPRIAAPGEVAVGGWSGYPALGVGYARESWIAAAVWAASVAMAKQA